MFLPLEAAALLLFCILSYFGGMNGVSWAGRMEGPTAHPGIWTSLEVHLMATVICPGSFDPITKGHLDIITRASRLFDHVIALVAINANKKPSFTAEERAEMIRKATAHLPNVTADTYEGLLADYVREKGAVAIVKGLRAMSDFEYEFQMALTNKRLVPEAETIFLTTQAENMYLNSSLVKQVASFGGDISDFVPPEVLNDITERLYRRKKEKSQGEVAPR